MRDDTIFRILIAALTVSGVAARIYFQSRAAHEGGPISPRREPGFWIGVVALTPLMLIPLVAFLINPDALAWSKIGLPRSLRWAGAALSIVAIPVLFQVFRHLGRNLTRTAGVRANAKLVTSGPYRFVRHPLYAVGTLMWIGVSLMAANWLMLLGIAVLLCILPLRMAVEEAALLERFGDDYREYARKTPRLWPATR